ncbi:biotin--[acetyl-CoA-carboxylase] ligase [Neptunitalea lumnitzerae]|uniref:Biotin--[acetyl-CoA-carboxylase] ligase n=1 Tax=Neptunitalea lumnitzerae TaxID=2965509 RepID=A0ABQ5MNA2_9FLAO|nr:biotin--[acetyl-CoA-carboxylase] ligase [Neptunitalea sp. Y10]GLB50886.1 biotin--[acetyl-CoA-carboxylase] ligase [Neptunitalea sp. Y10]
MNLIKLNATESTNSYLRGLLRETDLHDNTVVVTKDQTRGRGQMGTKWISEPDKNLTFSVYKKIQCLEIDEQFYISMAISIAIYKALSKLNVPDLNIKWPNDILSSNCKICGILIEGVIKQDNLVSVIAGVGLNVNQLEFSGLQSVSSLKRLTGVHYDLDELLMAIVDEFREVVKLVEHQKLEEIKSTYESLLFRKDKPSTFKDNGGNLFMGFIRRVNKSGRLVIELENKVEKEFELKEVKLLY